MSLIPIYSCNSDVQQTCSAIGPDVEFTMESSKTGINNLTRFHYFKKTLLALAGKPRGVKLFEAWKNIVFGSSGPSTTKGTVASPLVSENEFDDILAAFDEPSNDEEAPPAMNTAAAARPLPVNASATNATPSPTNLNTPTDSPPVASPGAGTSTAPLGLLETVAPIVTKGRGRKRNSKKDVVAPGLDVNEAVVSNRVPKPRVAKRK